MKQLLAQGITTTVNKKKRRNTDRNITRETTLRTKDKKDQNRENQETRSNPRANAPFHFPNPPASVESEGWSLL